MPRTAKRYPGALSKAIVDIIRPAFERTAMSQAAFGATVGISQSQFSKHLRGEVGLTVDELDAICHELGLSVVEVLDAADFASRDRFNREQ